MLLFQTLHLFIFDLSPTQNTCLFSGSIYRCGRLHSIPVHKLEPSSWPARAAGAGVKRPRRQRTALLSRTPLRHRSALVSLRAARPRPKPEEVSRAGARPGFTVSADGPGFQYRGAGKGRMAKRTPGSCQTRRTYSG